MGNCNFCGREITFDARVTSKRGIPVPVEPGTLESHDCEERAKTSAKPCRDCNNPIYWWNGKIGTKGNKIPLDVSTGKLHDCIVKREKEKEKPTDKKNDLWDSALFGPEYRS